MSSATSDASDEEVTARQVRQRVDSADEVMNRLRDEAVRSQLFDRAKEVPAIIMGRNELYITQLVDEYLKFLFLKAIAKDTDARHLSPSGEVDAIWHLHLLDTRSYMRACNECLDVSFIHHDPNGGKDRNQDWRFTNTKQFYKEVFGYAPHPEFWGDDDDENEDAFCNDCDLATVLGKGKRRLTLECGHVDCKCQPEEFFRSFIVKLNKKAYNSLYWSDYSVEEEGRARDASNALTTKIAEGIQEEEFLEFFQGDRFFFLRDKLSDAQHAFLDECPNHCADMEGSNKVMEVHIKTLCGRSINIKVLPSFSILHLKLLIQRKDGILVAHQRIIFGGRQLEDSDTLLRWGIQQDSVLHLVLRLCGC